MWRQVILVHGEAALRAIAATDSDPLER